MATMICNVIYHFENLEKYSLENNELFKKSMEELFMGYREGFAKMFNNKIDTINKAWNETGKPSSFGDGAENINPEYSNFIREHLQDDVDNYNMILQKQFYCPIEYYLDDSCDIRARVKILPEINIHITLEEVLKEEA